MEKAAEKKKAQVGLPTRPANQFLQKLPRTFFLIFCRHRKKKRHTASDTREEKEERNNGDRWTLQEGNVKKKMKKKKAEKQTATVAVCMCVRFYKCGGMKALKIVNVMNTHTLSSHHLRRVHQARTHESNYKHRHIQMLQPFLHPHPFSLSLPFFLNNSLSISHCRIWLIRFGKKKKGWKKKKEPT